MGTTWTGRQKQAREKTKKKPADEDVAASAGMAQRRTGGEKLLMTGETSLVVGARDTQVCLSLRPFQQ